VNHHITNANIKEWARDYDGPQFDGILCDPPYELGFMGKSWDSSGIAFDQDMWADLFRHIKPGGHLLAFSGSRTYHRMAVAIEDAGFEIRDMIEWVYGSGFPKSLNIGKAVDKLQGNEREVTGTQEREGRSSGILGKKVQITRELSTGTSLYEGYGTALKPAHEPCVLARKPIEGTVANNVLKHGTGGLNIDGTRVGVGAKKWSEPKGGIWSDSVDNGATLQDNPLGRFPANLIHDGSDEVEAVFPQTKAGVAVRRNKGIVASKNVTFNANDPTNTEDVGYGDSGSASRFFYTAKASKSERNAGLEGFEEVRKLNSYTESREGMYKDRNTIVKNHHPTVKPLSLTKYLATLIKPPTGGRLLVPFSGSGSEMIGALQAGWEYVEGVELTEEYIPIAEARIKHWLEQMAQEDTKPKQESLL
jgi:DNA modification methylase